MCRNLHTDLDEIPVCPIDELKEISTLANQIEWKNTPRPAGLVPQELIQLNQNEATYRATQRIRELVPSRNLELVSEWCPQGGRSDEGRNADSVPSLRPAGGRSLSTIVERSLLGNSATGTSASLSRTGACAIQRAERGKPPIP